MTTSLAGPLSVLLICLAGGVGATLRFVIDGVIRNRTGGGYPWGTTVINISGSLVLGAVTALGVQQLVAPEAQLVVGTGLLGGYTTFSTASYETVRLLEERRWGAAILNGIGQLAMAIAAAAGGFAVVVGLA